MKNLYEILENLILKNKKILRFLKICLLIRIW